MLSIPMYINYIGYSDFSFFRLNALDRPIKALPQPCTRPPTHEVQNVKLCSRLTDLSYQFGKRARGLLQVHDIFTQLFPNLTG